jgi:hypothetical protein
MRRARHRQKFSDSLDDAKDRRLNRGWHSISLYEARALR